MLGRVHDGDWGRMEPGVCTQPLFVQCAPHRIRPSVLEIMNASVVYLRRKSRLKTRLSAGPSDLLGRMCAAEQLARTVSDQTQRRRP